MMKDLTGCGMNMQRFSLHFSNNVYFQLILYWFQGDSMVVTQSRALQSDPPRPPPVIPGPTGQHTQLSQYHHSTPHAAIYIPMTILFNGQFVSG